jgi:hypothetical protein
VTAKDQSGKVIHTERRKYDNWYLWFEGGKEVELKLWDITAATNINLGLIPEQTDAETHIIFVDENTTSVQIEAIFLFEHEPDHWEQVKKVTRTVQFESQKKLTKK